MDRTSLALSLLAATVLAGCASSPEDDAEKSRARSAAEIRDVVEEVRGRYERLHELEGGRVEVRARVEGDRALDALGDLLAT